MSVNYRKNLLLLFLAHRNEAVFIATTEIRINSYRGAEILEVKSRVVCSRGQYQLIYCSLTLNGNNICLPLCNQNILKQL